MKVTVLPIGHLRVKTTRKIVDGDKECARATRINFGMWPVIQKFPAPTTSWRHRSVSPKKMKKM
jgi:hypothetical protein